MGTDAATPTATPPGAPETLLPEVEARLSRFARACRAAARAVSFYPAGHPAIRGALAHLIDVTAANTAAGPFALTVLPEQLLLNRAAPSRPDPAVVELAMLFHRHSIGALVLHGGSDTDSWRTLLVLLARAAEEVRADGGIHHLWTIAGGPSIEIREINYGELLRGRIGGESAELAALISHYIDGSVTLSLEDTAYQALMGLAKEQADKIAEVAAELQSRSTGPGTIGVQTAAILRVLRGLADVAMQSQPERFDTVFRKAASVGAHLTADVMAGLLECRGTDDAKVGPVDVVDALVERMDDSVIAQFVANSLTAEGGPTARLAQAFEALVPDPDERRSVLAMTEAQLTGSPLAVEQGFLDTWDRLEKIIETYSDRKYVSDDYAQELSAARARAVDVEQTSDDPPDRVAVWLATITDAALRKLDIQLLLDLLEVETEPFQWRDVLEMMVSHINDLTRVGYFEPATLLTEAVASQAEHGPGVRRPFASEALEGLRSKGPVMKHALVQLRKGDNNDFQIVKRLLLALGPAVIESLAEVWSVEEDQRMRRRLQEAVIAFGARGRDVVQKLMNAADWEVRRTAVYLLREFGGADALSALEPLLGDSDTRVQREAIRTVALMPDDRAYAAIVRALTSGRATARGSLMQELAELRDDRAAPLFCYLVRHLPQHFELRAFYLTSIEIVGRLGGADGIGALVDALQRGRWWTPFRNRAFRAAAATALTRIKTPAAVQALREASAKGPSGARRAAARELARLAEAT
ncbi:MAG: HEAT repeat domain-containing protein [Acidobacteria bacterium]|nr:HEAT repeat domain-containing protein [Acidobacteriota bacterium]